MRTLNNEELAAINADRWFSRLSPSLRHELLRFSKVRRYDAGEQIFWRYAPAEELCACAAGAVRMSSKNSTGKRFTLTYIGPGAWFGETSLFDDGGRQTHDAYAHGPTSLLCIEHIDVKKILAEHTQLYEALLAVSAERTRFLYELIEEMHVLPLEQRVARKLVALVRAYGVPLDESDGGSRIGLHLLQEDLAQLLGCSRQRVNEKLKRLERNGLIQVARRGLVIYDADALWRASQPAVMLPGHALGHYTDPEEKSLKRVALYGAERKEEAEKECLWRYELQDIPFLSDYLVSDV